MTKDIAILLAIALGLFAIMLITFFTSFIIDRHFQKKDRKEKIRNKDCEVCKNNHTANCPKECYIQKSKSNFELREEK